MYDGKGEREDGTRGGTDGECSAGRACLLGVSSIFAVFSCLERTPLVGCRQFESVIVSLDAEDKSKHEVIFGAYLGLNGDRRSGGRREVGLQMLKPTASSLSRVHRIREETGKFSIANPYPVF